MIRQPTRRGAATTTLRAVAMVVGALGAVAAEPGPPPAAPYAEELSRTVSLTDFCESPGNWEAVDRLRAWRNWQRHLRRNPQARLGVVAPYRNSLALAVRSGFGHASKQSLDVRWRSPGIGDGGRCGEPVTIYSRRRLPVDPTRYNRLSAWVYVEGARSACVVLGLETGHDGQGGRRRHPPTGGEPSRRLAIQAVPGGVWTHVRLDFHDASLAYCRRIRYLVLGHIRYGPEDGAARHEVHILWDDFRLDNVTNPRRFVGTAADPAVVTVNQLGYKPGAEKWAVAPADGGQRRFRLRVEGSDEVVFTGGLELRQTLSGPFLEADFSDFDAPGTYYVQVGRRRSASFRIGPRPYAAAAAATLSVLNGLRCGAATALHDACHLDCAWDTQAGRTVDLVGGYHTAGDPGRRDADVLTILSLLTGLYERLAPADPLRPALLAESDWCAAILQKHLRHFGYVAAPPRTPAGAPARHLTDNRAGTDDDFLVDASPDGDLIAAVPGLARLAAQREREATGAPAELLSRAVTLADRDGGVDPAADVALYRTTGRDRFLERARATAARWLQTQDNRTVETPIGIVSGELDAAAIKALPAIAELMRVADDELYYRLYFALRRFAEFYVKPLMRLSGPWGVLPEMRDGAVRPAAAGVAVERILGASGGHVRYVRASAGSAPAAPRTALALAHLAAALDDPAVEALAHRAIGQLVGANPYAVSVVYGLGTDAVGSFTSSFTPLAGMIAADAAWSRFNRTEVTGLDAVLQARAAVAFGMLDAPCRVAGRITRSGEAYTGKLLLRLPGGRVVRRLTTDADGRFGPEQIAGGAWYSLEAARVVRRFAAVSATVQRVDLDVEAEIAIRGLRVSGRPTRLVTGGGHVVPTVREHPVEMPLDGRLPRLAVGVPYVVRLQADALGRRRSSHAVSAHAANAAVTPTQLALDVRPSTPTTFQLTLTPRTPGETVCVRVDVDGDRSRRWELLAVAVPHPAYVRGRLTVGGAPRAGRGEVLDMSGRVVAEVQMNAQGRFAPVALPGAGSYRIRLQRGTSSIFDVGAGALATVELDAR